MNTKNIIIGIVVATLIIGAFFLLTKKQEGYQSTNLLDCQENCLNTYPNDWESWERQLCMTRCRMTDKEKLMNISPSIDTWINDMNLCVEKQCGVNDCAQKCDSMFIKPVKPRREEFTADEDYYQALAIYDQEMAKFLQQRQECFVDCEDEVSSKCKKKCCIDAKLCNFLKTDREKETCKMSCDMVGMKMKKMKKM
jgi:hypothetical protein